MNKAIVFGVVLALAGCTGGPKPGDGSEGGSCSDTSDCDSGLVCYNDVCRTVCAEDRDCADGTFACIDDVCVPVENPTCTQDTDCTAPTVCEYAATGTCVGGACTFVPIPDGTACTVSGAYGPIDGICDTGVCLIQGSLTDGESCTGDWECASSNCSEEYALTTKTCRPAGLCADGLDVYAVGYRLCTGNTFYRECESEGNWSDNIDNPNPDNITCDAGGGAASGYQLADTCMNGTTRGFTAGNCNSCSPYMADASGTRCLTDCATNEDDDCWSSFACNPADRCVGVLADGNDCDFDSDCSSNNCSENYSGGSDKCAPAGQCADGSTYYDVNYALCNGNTSVRVCTAEGVWSAVTNNPDPTNDYCDPGGGTNSGYDRAATCTSGDGGGFTDPGCYSCEPYLAASTTSCVFDTCEDDDDCYDGWHCDDIILYECISGDTGTFCHNNGDCDSGSCDTDAHLCTGQVGNGQGCTSDPNCTSSNCSADFNSGNSYCAPANQCADNGNFYAIGYILCGIDGNGDEMARTCTAEGVWGTASYSEQEQPVACNFASNGDGTGIDPAAACTSGTGWTNEPCTSCNGYIADPGDADGCRDTCTNSGNVGCWPGWYCFSGDTQCYTGAPDDNCDSGEDQCDGGICTTSDICVALGGTGAPCQLNSECDDGHCECGDPTCDINQKVCSLSDCGVCEWDNGNGNCGQLLTIHTGCPACQRCVPEPTPRCANQDGTDYKNDCNPDPGCGDGLCYGGACDYEASGTDCSNSCRSAACNNTGICESTGDLPDNTPCGGQNICCDGECVGADGPCICGSCGNVCEPGWYCNTSTDTCGPTCFAAGTPVTMADGTTRPIELIEIGDQVLGYDVEAGRTVPARVSFTFVHPETAGSLLVNGHLHTTPEHPFFVDGEWVTAAELDTGSTLFTVSGTSAVHSIESVAGSLTTYNLEVDGMHNYFAGGVLVHNKVEKCLPDL